MTRDSAPVMNHVDRLVHEVILGSLFINNNTPITTVTSSVFVESASLYTNVDSVAFTGYEPFISIVAVDKRGFQ